MENKELAELRRTALKAYIKAEFEGVPNRFARRLGISQSYLDGLLKGHRSFGEKQAQKLERLLIEKGCKAVRLFAPSPSADTAAAQSTLENDVLEAFRRLAPARQDEIARQLAKEVIRNAPVHPRPPLIDESESGEAKRRTR